MENIVTETTQKRKEANLPPMDEVEATKLYKDQPASQYIKYYVPRTY